MQKILSKSDKLPYLDHMMVITHKNGCETFYKEILYDLAEGIHSGATEFIIEHPRKCASFHEAVSKIEREFAQFKERVWDKDPKGAIKELDDLIIKATATRALVSHLIDAD